MAILSALSADISNAPLAVLITYLVPAALIWYATVVVYRLYFHPLSHIPGPLAARATHLYCFYHNVIRGGKFYLKVEQMHKKYGPVVRITPSEVHLSDPGNYDKINFVGTPYVKDPAFYHRFGNDHSSFSTISNEEHRIKRAALGTFFSQKRVLELEDIVQAKAQKLEDRMRSELDTSGRINLHHGFRAISVDVITDYAFDDCYDFLSQGDFGRPFFNMIRGTGTAIWFFQQFPFVQPIALAAPFWLVKIMSAPIARVMTLNRSCSNHISKVKKAVDAGEEMQPSRRTIFHQLLKPGFIKGYTVPTVEQLTDEAIGLVAAASDTTGNAMTIATYNTVINPEIYKRVNAELKEAFPDANAKLDLTTLEKLPYLNAVIKEGLRLSYGVVGRLPRIVPPSGAGFNGYTIPGGATVGMSSWMMHRNKDIFPEPDKFDPSRWLDPTTSKSMEKYLVFFGKGTRQCVGMPLAYSELRVTLGRIFRHFDNLTTERKSLEDLMYDDYFSPFHAEGKNKFIFSVKT
ncbi:hypothetical protein AJ79_09387 [Helicocarpus griseus UAMH5409]|uniref:Cytochrome P450 n=1 Tax=Helicocarpus griseus UAMH5409 TaxID=1447875 RepID=A0A2B7WKC1_9EURO|nr:hypothetical protein AJ79_09387 [Helicocarpus griseus UAMH5409]